MHFRLLWPRPLSSSLGNSELHCEVVNYICQLAKQIAKFEMKLATSVPTKLVHSEVVLFSFLRRQKRFNFSREWFSLVLFCGLVRQIYKLAEFGLFLR